MYASPARVYLPGGRVAHLSKDDRREFTECGMWWPCGGFFGTGSQNEYDEAARRRRCALCVRKAGSNW